MHIIIVYAWRCEINVEAMFIKYDYEFSWDAVYTIICNNNLYSTVDVACLYLILVNVKYCCYAW